MRELFTIYLNFPATGKLGIAARRITESSYRWKLRLSEVLTGTNLRLRGTKKDV